MGPLNTRNFMVLTVILALCATAQSRDDGAYLPKTGPSPLRFSLATANFGAFTLPTALLSKPLRTNSTEIAEVKTNSVDTNSLTVQIPSRPPAVNDYSTGYTPDFENNPPAPVQTPAAASDLLVVSPQMLTEFFKPGPGGSNATIVPVVLPTPVGFTPPSAKLSSQATYKSP